MEVSREGVTPKKVGFLLHDHLAPKDQELEQKAHEHQVTYYSTKYLHPLSLNYNLSNVTCCVPF